VKCSATQPWISLYADSGAGWHDSRTATAGKKNEMKCAILQPISNVGAMLLRDADVIPIEGDESSPTRATVARMLRDVDAVISRNAVIDRDAIENAARLRVISIHGIGHDPIDIAAATENGIVVCNTPTANIQSVAEHAIALMLAVARMIPQGDLATRRGDFSFKYANSFYELHGKTLLIVGWGQIGELTARLAKAAFAMNILAYSPSAEADDIAGAGARKCEDLHDALALADVVSLHVPIRPETRNLIAAPELSAMKPSAILINTGRGAVVNEMALGTALKEFRIKGAGLDVFVSEDMSQGHPFLDLKNVVLTPHVGGTTEEGLDRAAREAAEHVLAVLRGETPRSLLNGPF
jgi:D-3-phosphoglycerate dehydrogenase